MDVSTLSLVLVVAITVSLLKPFLELFLKLGSPLHDTSIRLAAIVVGIVGALADFAVHSGNWGNGLAVEAAAGTGLAAGVGAVVIYHLLTADVFFTLGASEPVSPVVAPVPPVVAPIAATEPFPAPPAV